MIWFAFACGIVMGIVIGVVGVFLAGLSRPG